MSYDKAAELHKKIKKNFERWSYSQQPVDYLWEADLADFSRNTSNGYKYVLTVIDVGSRYAWARPVANKQAESIAVEFDSILIESKRAPEVLETDDGGEFKGEFKKLLERKGIKQRVLYNLPKAAFAESFNKTLHGIIARKCTANNTKKWDVFVADAVHEYNNKVHSALDMTPTEHYESPPKIVPTKPLKDPASALKKAKFKIGDIVLLTKKETAFKKGYEAGWLDEFFIVSEVLMNHEGIPRYKCIDLDGEDIKGAVYNEMMQRSRVNLDSSEIEKIGDTRRIDGRKMTQVKFKKMKQPVFIRTSNIKPSILPVGRGN